MKQVNYILVHETDSKNAACDVTYRDVPYIGHCVVCDTSSMFKVKGSSERQALISELCRWRNHWPEARKPPYERNPDFTGITANMIF